MFSDIAFGRLVWKEYRTHRPLWLALLIGTPVLQILFLSLHWMMRSGHGEWVNSDGIAMVFGISFATSFIYLLGCAGTAFSIEHETGSFDWQRVLPTHMLRVLLAKAGFALVSGMTLTLLVWLFTRGIFGPEAQAQTVGEWFGLLGLLYLSEVLAWSLCASMLVRQPLWSVVAAVCGHALMNYVLFPALTGPFEAYQISPFQSPAAMVRWRIFVLAILIVADVVLGRLWFEDRLRLPRWRLRWKPEFVPSYPVAAELPPYLGPRQVGWRRLLWLSWRDARWVTAGVLAWYGYVYWTLRHPNDWEGLMLISFIGSFVIGLFAFAPEQWGGRFRFLTERGCTPRLAWLCRQALWLPPVLLMCLATKRMQGLENALHPHDPAHRAYDVMMAVMMPLVCYAAGQFAAMLFRSTVMAIAVGIGLCFVGGMWSGLMTTLLAPTWWAVGSLPVIGLFVTWLKANDWIEERRDRVARWRTVLGVGLPIISLLTVSATHRVVQIPAVDLPREWDETSVVMARLTAEEIGTLAIYHRALAEIESGEDQLETFQSQSERLRKEHPDWTATQIYVESFEGFHRDWWKQHAAVVPLLREAHKMVAVPLTLLDDESKARPGEWNPDRGGKLPWLMMRQAEESLRAGELDQTWDDIVMAFELQRRFDQRATLPKEWLNRGMGSVQESYLLQTVIKWGRHKEQTRSRVLAAICKLEEVAAASEAVQREIHHGLLESQSRLNRDENWIKYQAAFTDRSKYWEAEIKFEDRIWSIFPWEQWRAHRAVRLQASLLLTRFKQLQTSLKWGLPSTNVNSQNTASEKMLAPNPLEHGAPLETMLETTVMPSHRMSDLQSIEGYTFWPRADSFRATMLLLALTDFHREHKRFPESLTELVPTYFADAPRDPRSGGPFVYFPQGVPEDMEYGEGGRENRRVLVVRKERPFLVTTYGGHGVESKQKPDGSWEFINESGKRLKLYGPEKDYMPRIWPVEEP